jgi:alpha-galactosidase
MAKVTFLGAGSTVFAKNVLGDTMLSSALHDAHLALYDIDATRLAESRRMLETINKNVNQGRAKITAHLGVAQRKEALRGASYVVNAIQVGGYKPSTVIDFEIPTRYGLRQTIADTLGIGGIFRALRTIPVMLDFARDMEQVCPEAWLMNYTNPMAMLTGAMLRGTSVRTVGLCHSVQGCADGILGHLGFRQDVKKLQWKIAGINHQSWLLEVTDGGRDLYPEIKARAAALLEEGRRKGGPKHWDMVRHYLMLNFGYYITESSEHNAEYTPYFIKSQYPELIEEFNIPLDEYPRRCVNQIASWKKMSAEITRDPNLSHVRSHEYGSYIMEAMESDVPFRIGGNVMNTGIITNLPAKACVEVPCLVDRNGVQPCFVGDLPEQCAALNRTNINPQILTVDAALTLKKDCIYQAAMLDPHTAAELPIDKIRAMCDDLIEAHGKMLPRYTATTIKPADLKQIYGVPVSTWKIAGPFPGASAVPALDLATPADGAFQAKATMTGMAGKKITWKTVEAGRHGQVNLGDVCGAVDHALAVAVTELHAPRVMSVKLGVGSDDGILIELNGKEVFRHECVRGAAPNQDSVVLKLKKGTNVLRFKISQITMGWEFYAALFGKECDKVKCVCPQ